MKKLLTLILALAMTLSLAACGGDDAPAESGGEEGGSGEATKMTLILRGGAYGESLQAMLEPFAEEHNVEFEVLLQEFDALHTGIALDAVNETGTYDLCMVDGSWMAEFTENGVLAELDSYVADGSLSMDYYASCYIKVAGAGQYDKGNDGDYRSGAEP